jgi:hypothetical protein
MRILPAIGRLMSAFGRGENLNGAYSQSTCRRGSLNVRFALKATELLRHRELSRRPIGDITAFGSA